MSTGVLETAVTIALSAIGGGGGVALYTNWDRTKREKALAMREVVANLINAVSDFAALVYGLPTKVPSGLPDTDQPKQDTVAAHDAFRAVSRAHTRFDLLISDRRLRDQQEQLDEPLGALSLWLDQYNAAHDSNPQRVKAGPPVNLITAYREMNDAISEFERIARQRLPK